MTGVSENPPTTRRPEKAARSTRILAGAFSLGCLAVLAIGALLTPAAEGHGTHTQLGMPDCAWAMAFEAPCLTCGMTTSFSHAGEGDLLDSFLTQPMGFLLVLAAATIVWGGAHIALTGSQIAPFAARVLSKRGLVLIGVLTLGAWAYKMATWSGS